RPLLQCTDPELFNPGRAQPDTGPEALWVGNSRGVERPLLRMALSSGVKVSIHGSGWQPFVDDSLVISEFVPNDLLGSLYAGARVVLNDHWEDMQRDGFLSNRLFDAVACGTRVLSDEVEGIEELFAGSVRTVASQADVDRILGGPLDKWFDDRESRLATAARVAAEHSFDARARQLVEAVAAERGRVAGRPSSVPAP
ncbi:MAG: glycosyltransferase, partial [Propionibacterium sp.]|nr:glycosyltransferase [Propionibacterium sp.]